MKVFDVGLLNFLICFDVDILGFSKNWLYFYPNFLAGLMVGLFSLLVNQLTKNHF